MRKKVSVLVLAVLLLCLSPIQSFAMETDQKTDSVIQPRWVSITDFANSFNISGSGLAQLNTALYARSNINKVVITQNLQQYVNGSWKTIKSWTGTFYSSSGYMNKSWYVTSGYYYRMVSTGAVYQNNVLVEQVSYTGPSYWY